MKAVIVEDEVLSSRHLKKLLEEIGGIQVIAQLDSIEDTVQWFHENNTPDVLFLDIHLADGSSFDIFEQVAIHCPIVFTTAYDEYALDAFKVNSISYLLKPLKKSDVQEGLDKLKRLRGQSDPSPELKELLRHLRAQSEYKSHFLVSARGDKLLPLKVEDIAYIHIAEGIVKAHTYDGTIYFMDQTLDELGAQLNPLTFHRVNRQYILARNAIRDLDQWFHSRLSVNLTVPAEEKILISRANVAEFKRWFSGRLS